MAGEDRRIPGEGLVKRMEARTRRRPRIGMSPAFYTRLGLDDPWASPDRAEERSAGSDSMVFLSGAPYYAMLQKLAASARRRERRQARFTEARAGTTMRAARRAWPGEGPLFTPRITALALDSMRLPEAPAPQIVEVEVGRQGRGRGGEEPASPVLAWAKPAVLPTRRAAASADHAGQRLVRAVEDRAAEVALAGLPQRSRAQLAMAQPQGQEPLRAATIETVRRSRLPRPVVRVVEEEAGFVLDAPVARALRRGTGAVARVARAPATSSPLFQMAAYAAEMDRAAATSLAAPERGEAMRPASARRVPPTQRASGRGDRVESGTWLSASPVRSSRVSAGRPLSASPVQSVAQPAGGGPGPSPAFRVNPERRAAAKGRASALALARYAEASPALPAAPAAGRTRLVQDGRGTVRRPERTFREAETLVARPDREVALPVATPLGPALSSPSAPPRSGRERQSVLPAEETPLTVAAERSVASPTRRAALRAAPVLRTASVLSPPVQLGSPRSEVARSVGLRPLREDPAPAELVDRHSARSPVAGLGWAVARSAAVEDAPRRSALPRITPAAFTTLSGETGVPSSSPAASSAPAWSPPVSSVPAASPSASPAASPLAASAPRALRSSSTAAPRTRGPGLVARAVTRGSDSAPTVRAAHAPLTTPAVDPVRRSGPLSWARPVATAPLVASTVSRQGRSPSQIQLAPPGEELAELVRSGLVQSSWSPSTPVRTPDGRYISARVAARIPGLAILPAVNGPVAISATAVSGYARASGWRTPDVRFVGAPVGVSSPNASGGAASAFRPRPTDWVAARTAITQATAYRGAIGVRSPEATYVGASSSTTPRGSFVGASSSTTPRGSFVGASSSTTPAGSFVGASSSTTPAGSFVGASSSTTPRGSFVGASSSTTPAGRRGLEWDEDPLVPRTEPRRRRPGLEATLADVSAAQPQPDSPSWAARSDGTPQVRSAQGLFQSLARATTAEQVVRVIAARAGTMTGPVPLTDPMRTVVEQIRQELRGPGVAAEGTPLRVRAAATPEAAVLRPSRSPSSGSVASTAVTRSGSPRPVRSSAVVRGASGGDDRVNKLVKRLTDLIHLAETERRLEEARSQVRMADDSAEARAEGSGPVGPGAGGGAKLDMEAFSREVLDVVSRELELRRERRTEDGDGSEW